MVGNPAGWSAPVVNSGSTSARWLPTLRRSAIMDPCSVQDAFRQGQPLVELWIRFHDGVDYRHATELLDGLGPDIDVGAGDWYSPNTRCAQVTADGMLRLFNIRMQRIPMPREFPGAYTWLHIARLTEWPAVMDGLIAEGGMTQPRSYDDGQPYPKPAEPLHPTADKPSK